MRGLNAAVWGSAADRLLRNFLIQPSSTSVKCNAAGSVLHAARPQAWPVVGDFLAHFFASKAAEAQSVPDASRGFKDGGFEVTHFPRERVR